MCETIIGDGISMFIIIIIIIMTVGSEGQIRPPTTLVRLGKNAAVSEYQ
jgi:hypothetical protein